jgi:hypothetical protein
MQDKLNPSDLLPMLLASFGHDLRHPGVNNGFLVNTRHDLAQTYNDMSVLENYHASSLIKIIEASQLLEFFEGINTLRKIMIRAVLSTDISAHFSILQKWND